MKFILTDDIIKISMYRMAEAYFVAELYGANWKVVKNKLTGELGWMSWAEVKKEIELCV